MACISAFDRDYDKITIWWMVGGFLNAMAYFMGQVSLFVLMTLTSSELPHLSP